jgi:hypothetical protein
MIRATLGRLGFVLELAAGVALVAVSGRFAFSSLAFAIERRSPQSEEVASTPTGTASAKQRSRVAPRARSTSSTHRPSEPRARPKPRREVAGTPLRISVIVSAGPPRSEVYVDGILVGNTPYLGIMSCKAGEIVRVQIVPPAGLPWSYERRCVPEATIRITEEPRAEP